MKIVHLETTKLVRRTIIRPANACGNMGSHNGELWAAVTLTHRQALDHVKVRAAWNARNPTLRAVSVNTTWPSGCTEAGLHASLHPFDALRYAPGTTLCKVQVFGTIIEVVAISTR